MNLKEIAKKSALLYWVNAKLKCYHLKRDLSRLIREYSAKARARKFEYDAQEAVDEFKRRHKLYCPKFSPRAPGALRVFWIGACQSQDESGLLQAFHRLAKVKIFYNSFGGYGFWKGDGKASFAEVRKVNDEALYKLVCEAHAENVIDVLLGLLILRQLSNAFQLNTGHALLLTCRTNASMPAG